MELIGYSCETIISEDSWKNAISHVEKFENQYWERDKFILNQNSLIIQINPDSDEDEIEQNSTSFWRPWEIV